MPIWVLWHVQMKRRQKLGLGILLCSNILLVVLACLELSGLRYHDTMDITWLAFTQQLQISAGVLVFSLTAFRSLFTTEKPKFVAREIKSWYSTKEDIRHGRKQRILPSIPSATLTSVRAFIRRGRRANTLDTEAGIDYPDDVLPQDLGQVAVLHDLSSEAQEVSYQSQPPWLPADTIRYPTIDYRWPLLLFESFGTTCNAGSQSTS